MKTVEKIYSLLSELFMFGLCLPRGIASTVFFIIVIIIVPEATFIVAVIFSDLE